MARVTSLKRINFYPKGGVYLMDSEEFAQYWTDQRLQLEARDQARQRKAKRKRRVPLNSEPTPPRLLKGENPTHSAPTFFSTWDAMYRRRIRNGQGATPFTLPESLTDALIKRLEQIIHEQVKKLLP